MHAHPRRCSKSCDFLVDIAGLILWLQSCRPNPVVATLSVSPKRFFDSSPTILHLEPTRFDSPRVSGRNLLPEVQRRFKKKNRTGRVHVERPEERGGLAVGSDCFVFHCWHPKMGNLCADDSKLRNVRETKGARGNRQQLRCWFIKTRFAVYRRRTTTGFFHSSPCSPVLALLFAKFP